MSRPPDSWFAAALGSLTLVGPLAIHLFLPVMPEVKASFAVSDALAELTISVTFFVMALATLVYGTLSDRYGRRPILLAGLAFFITGSLVSALAPSVLTLILGRLVQALGAGCGITLARAIARDAYGPDRLVNVIAYLTMAYTLGPMLAPPIGGLLDDLFGWRSVFWFAFLAGTSIAIAAFFILRETRADTMGARRSGSVFREYAQLFADARFTGFVLQSGFCSGTFFAMVAASPFLMSEQLGRSATEYGLYFFLLPAGYFAGNVLSSRLSNRVSVETMVLAGSLLPPIAIAVQAGFILTGGLTPLLIFLPAVIVSTAQGVALPNAQAGAIRVVPELAGTASGIGVFLQVLCSAIFSEVYGLLADGTAVPMLLTASVGAVLTLLAGALPFIAKRRAAPA